MKIIFILLIAITIMPAIAQEVTIEKELRKELQGQIIDQVKEATN